MTTGKPIISIQNLSQNFGSISYALRNIHLEVRPGSIIGLLGANGSGKSTLLRHMTGLYLPTEGSCTTFGTVAEDLQSDNLCRIGYVHQEGELLDYLTVGQHINYVAAHYSKWNTQLEKNFRDRFELDTDKKTGNLSPGQRQRLSILLAICFEPELLILDEPAAALDPLARRDFLNLLLEMIQDSNRTIIISSHILSDIEKIIDHVLILKDGRICCNQGLDEVKETYCRLKITSMNSSLPDDLDFVDSLEIERDERQAIVTMKQKAADEIEKRFQELDCKLEKLPLSFEEVYRLIVEEDVKEEVIQ